MGSDGREGRQEEKKVDRDRLERSNIKFRPLLVALVTVVEWGAMVV